MFSLSGRMLNVTALENVTYFYTTDVMVPEHVQQSYQGI